MRHLIGNLAELTTHDSVNVPLISRETVGLTYGILVHLLLPTIQYAWPTL